MRTISILQKRGSVLEYIPLDSFITIWYNCLVHDGRVFSYERQLRKSPLKFYNVAEGLFLDDAEGNSDRLSLELGSLFFFLHLVGRKI